MNIQKTTIIAIAATIATTITATASADIITIDEFESLQVEGFENMQGGFVRDAVSVFDGMGSVYAGDLGGWIHRTGSWGFNSTVRAREGNYFMGSGSGSVIYQFDDAQKSFGGFFATNSNKAGGLIKFFDDQDQLLAQSTVNADLGGEWSWNGWSLDQGFSSVEVSGNYGNGGFLMMDSIRVGPATIPAPGAIALLLTGGLVISRRRRA